MSALVEKIKGNINFQIVGEKLKWGITNILVHLLSDIQCALTWLCLYSLYIVISVFNNILLYLQVLQDPCRLNLLLEGKTAFSTNKKKPLPP